MTLLSVDPFLVGFAFASGSAAFLNPCGFAMLPAYISDYLGNKKEIEVAGNPHSSVTVFKGAMIGSAVTLGFVALFGLVGLLLSYLGPNVVKVMPSVALILGFILIVIGSLVLAKVPLHVPIPSVNITTKEKTGYVRYFSFGVGYAIASLGCTIPIFMLVVLAALSTGGFFSSFVMYLAYAAGMGWIMVLLSAGVGGSKLFVKKYVTRVLPYMRRISGAIIIGAGIYIIYFQVVIGRLFEFIA